MKIIRYQTNLQRQPASKFFGLRDEMDRLFDVAFSSRIENRGAEFPLDLYETENSFVLRAELPGFRKEDLNVEVAEGQLSITAHQKEAAGERDQENSFPVEERRVTRSIPLPEKTQADVIQAEYENGVLTITLPRQEKVKPRQVAITVK